MSPHGPCAKGEQELRRRLRQFNTRTRRRAAVLTGREEMAGSVDPDHIIRELMDNWAYLERILIRHGAFYPLIDKVRRIRNSVEHHDGRFTRNRKAHVDAMRSVGMLEMAVRSAGAEEGRSRKREAEPGSGHGDRPDAAAPSGSHPLEATYPSQPAGEPSR